MIFWLCSIITLGAGVAATFIADMRLAVFFLWIVGMGAGGIYLSAGAELLAVIQWIVSTLLAISFIYYSVMFGEYKVSDSSKISRKLILLILPVLAGAGLATVLWFAARQLPDMPTTDVFSLTVRASNSIKGVADLGKSLVQDHLLSLEILALTLFVVVIGSGVVARPEVKDE